MIVNNELFKDFSDQKLAIQILKSAIEKGQLAPAYLFTGPTGVGKKEIALRFFEGISNKSFNSNTRHLLELGNHPDLYIIEPTYLHQGNLIPQSIAIKENFKSTAQPQIRLDQIKDLKIFLSKKPIQSELSMVIIDNVDVINESASNALLKTIEEPSKGIILLLSSRPQILLDTIKSRCQTIPFKPYNSKLLNQKILNHNLSKQFNQNVEELLSISYGSPLLLENNLEILSNIPENIWGQIKNLQSQKPVEALFLAKEIAENLDFEQQLLLINWMQQYYWNKTINSKIVRRLERLRVHLKSYINTRIAWEIALIDIIELN